MARSTTRVPEISGSTFSQTTASTPASINSNLQVVQSTTVRPSDDERIETMTKLMKKEKTKAITQFYPDYDYEKTEEENIEEEDRVASPKIKSSSNKVCSSVRPKPLFWFTYLGPIPKPKPKLSDTFGRYRNRYRNHISKGKSSYQS